MGIKLTSLTVCKTHWGNKHCTCNRLPCLCFPAEKYEPLFLKPEVKLAVHHNQVRGASWHLPYYVFRVNTDPRCRLPH